jgi:hypothetical protein
VTKLKRILLALYLAPVPFFYFKLTVSLFWALLWPVPYLFYLYFFVACYFATTCTAGP